MKNRYPKDGPALRKRLHKIPPIGASLKTGRMPCMVLAALFILSLSAPSAGQNSDMSQQQPGQVPEAISIEGNALVTSSGETIVFKGVNVADPVRLVEKGHWEKAHFAEARAWGANIIRLPIHPVAWRELGEEAYMELLDEAILWARELGLYLIFEWHSIGNLKTEMFHHEMYITSLDETRAFWNTIAKNYKNEPVVALYEIFNEPVNAGERFGTMSWAEWKAINEELIDVIRAHDPAVVCAVAGFNWGYDLKPVATDPVDRPAIAYISHPYPQKRKAPWEKKWQADWGYVAEKYPVLLTEIGFAVPGEKGLHVPVEGDETYGRILVDFAAERGISWVVWCFDADWPPLMFTDWDYTPTRQGAFFKKAMQE